MLWALCVGLGATGAPEEEEETRKVRAVGWSLGGLQAPVYPVGGDMMGVEVLLWAETLSIVCDLGEGIGLHNPGGLRLLVCSVIRSCWDL